MPFVFATTLFISATLLFVVQPMFAKMVVPLLGGTPAVWNTCMVFYQAALLAGYLYAHLSTKWLGARRQAAAHLALFCLPWLVLPIAVAEGSTPPPEANPIPWLLLLLAVSVGLPLLFVSASAPMLQAWFADTGHTWAKDPYFLYAASNLGSIIALLGYPALVEPSLALARGNWSQTWCWAAGYGLLMVLTAVCAVLLWRSPRASRQADGADAAESSPGELSPDPPTFGRRMRWLALSFAPSSLLLGVTTHISTDIAVVPLLWVIPLVLYLLSFVLVFARRKVLPHKWTVRGQPFFVAPLAVVFFLGCSRELELIPLHLAAFFFTAMVCHGELAAARPARRYLTEFYIWMSVGGVLGGLFNALVAPGLFSTILEYPLVIAAACLLRPGPDPGQSTAWARRLDFVTPLVLGLVFGLAAFGLQKTDVPEDWVRPVLELVAKIGLKQPAVTADMVLSSGLLILAALVGLTLMGRPLRFALGVAALLFVSLLSSGKQLRPMHVERSFFGVLRVRDASWHDYDGVLHKRHELMHGSTSHGMQDLDPEKRRKPLTYYHREGPLGELFVALAVRKSLHRIGVIGLGTGTIACYGEPDQHVTFFEIDPAVERIARNPKYFTYLEDCRAEVAVVLGDARLSLVGQPDGRFDLLILDAFSSDAIPVHLITRQALRLYLRKLVEDGVLAVHISNRYLDLKPVLANLAEDAGVVCRVFDDDAERDDGKFASTWAVLAAKPEDLGELLDESHWEPLETDPKLGLWTDDFSNILSVLK